MIKDTLKDEVVKRCLKKETCSCEEEKGDESWLILKVEKDVEKEESKHDNRNISAHRVVAVVRFA